MCDGEYHIRCRMRDGSELNVMDGASRLEVLEALDNLTMDSEDDSMWQVFKKGMPMVINPKYIMYAEMSD